MNYIKARLGETSTILGIAAILGTVSAYLTKTIDLNTAIAAVLTAVVAIIMPGKK